MNGYYKDRVKVVGVDLLCFPINAKTLEPLSCGCYDPYAWTDPDPEPVETIGVGEWQRRRNEQRPNPYNAELNGGASRPT